MLPIVMNLKVYSSEGIRAVVLCPVRELAAQIAREFRRLVPGNTLRVRVLTTALFKTADFSTLPCDILITTPLRLEHLLKAKKIDLSRVEYLVMDESDKLFEMGFVEQIDSVVAACSNPKVIRALFSATLPDAVEELSRTIMPDPIRIIVGEKFVFDNLVQLHPDDPIVLLAPLGLCAPYTSI
jgi:ATP-dependent RNA helicase DDX52/ROK1